ncbi:methyltransferase family protein [Nocardioides sp. NPDC058538]|uniref:methyltransferase family protein n=1 Tax=Nocardioides sp. NPDC058538 TaxID=3346542 RepID=UPI0036656CA9
MFLARWTLLDRHVVARGWAQALCAGCLIVGGPLAVLAPEPRWPDVITSAGVQLAVVCALPSVAAMRELAIVGRGTPLPYDPPIRLVTSGPYAYVRNPMQISMVLVFVALALTFGDAWLLVAAVAAAAYSVGLAAWHEGAQLRRAFGDGWVAYRAEVPSWVPRWRPAAIDSATLWVAADCGICSEVGRWFLRHEPRGLAIRPAAEHPEVLYRVTYESAGVRVSGVEAVARALNHIDLRWAMAGWALGLPGVRHLVQLCTDAFGAGPRPSRSADPASVRQEQDDRLCDACGLGGALDLDRRLDDELKAGGELGDLAEGDDRADAGADQDRHGEPDLVEAVVELRAGGLQRIDAHAEVGDQR